MINHSKSGSQNSKPTMSKFILFMSGWLSTNNWESSGLCLEILSCFDLTSFFLNKVYLHKFCPLIHNDYFENDTSQFSSKYQNTNLFWKETHSRFFVSAGFIKTLQDITESRKPTKRALQIIQLTTLILCFHENQILVV